MPGLAQRYLKHRSPVVERGFTLLEVLVTLVVVSIGLISIAQLQTRSLQYSHASLQRTIAVVQANDLVERFWTGYCDANALAEDGPIFTDWETFHRNAQDQQNTLPNWTASLDADNAPIYRLDISWGERSEDEDPSFTYFFRLIAPDNPGLSC